MPLLPRRMRRLSMDELLAGTLILYPRYMSRTQNDLISPEEALQELTHWYAQSSKSIPWWRKFFRIILRNVVGVL